MSNNINRVSAEEDIRRLSVTGGASSEQGFKQTQEALSAEMGSIYRRSEIAQVQEGLSKLRNLAGLQRPPK